MEESKNEGKTKRDGKERESCDEYVSGHLG